MTVLADPARRIRALGHAPWPTDRVLIIRERPEADAMSLLNEVAPPQAQRVTVDDKNTELRPLLLQATDAGTWLVADIKDDLTPDSVTAIKEISRGELHQPDSKWCDLPEGFRFIALIDRGEIANQSYRNFLNLFDSAIAVS